LARLGHVWSGFSWKDQVSTG